MGIITMVLSFVILEIYNYLEIYSYLVLITAWQTTYYILLSWLKVELWLFCNYYYYY